MSKLWHTVSDTVYKEHKLWGPIPNEPAVQSAWSTYINSCVEGENLVEKSAEATELTLTFKGAWNKAGIWHWN